MVQPYHCIGVGICSGEDVDVHVTQLTTTDVTQPDSASLNFWRLRVDRYRYEGESLQASAVPGMINFSGIILG